MVPVSSPRAGIHRQAVSIAAAIAPFGVAFGVAAADAGLSPLEAVSFSLLVFAGGAQFAAVSVLGDGGTVIAAMAAGLLLNLRLLAFGLIMAPSLRGPRWRRALESQLIADESTAVASAQPDHRWRHRGFLAAGLLLFVVWNVATLAGALVGSGAGDAVQAWGLDATIPAVFLALVWQRLRSRDQLAVALAGGAIALVLVPVAPPGVPIVVAAAGVIAGLR
jgi:4-azaleucine resistance transporter AzlC